MPFLPLPAVLVKNSLESHNVYWIPVVHLGAGELSKNLSLKFWRIYEMVFPEGSNAKVSGGIYIPLGAFSILGL